MPVCRACVIKMPALLFTKLTTYLLLTEPHFCIVAVVKAFGGLLLHQDTLAGELITRLHEHLGSFPSEETHGDATDFRN